MLERITNAWLGTIATNALILAFNVGTGVLLARLLLPEGRGLLATIMFWPGLISSVGLMSLDHAVAHRVARAPTESRRTGATATCLALALCCLVAPALALTLPYLLGDERREWWLTAQIYALAFIPVTYLGSIVRALDYGELRLIRYNSWRIIPPFVYLAGLSLMGVDGLRQRPLCPMVVVARRGRHGRDPDGLPRLSPGPQALRRRARHLFRLALPFHGTDWRCCSDPTSIGCCWFCCSTTRRSGCMWLP